MQLIFRYPLMILSLGAALALMAAWVAEYGFGLAPCELCLLQRIPFYVVIGLGVIFQVFSVIASTLSVRGNPETLGGASTLRNDDNKNSRLAKTILILMILALLTNSGIATYHMGVEQKWWPGPGSCSGEMLDTASLDDLRQQILQAPVVRCDEPALELFGFLTMASANIFYSLLLAIIGMVALRKKRAI